MLEFQPLQLRDLPRLRSFFNYSGSRLCDTTAGAVFIWRDLYHTEYAIHDGSLYFKGNIPELGEFFTLPLGGGRIEHYKQISSYCRERGIPVCFYPIPKDEVERFHQFFPNCVLSELRDTFDYLYRAEDLKYFKGRKFGGQRNHINKFHKITGSWTFRPITPEDVPAVRDFLGQYAETRDKDFASYHEDLLKTYEVLDNLETYDMLSGMLLADGRIVGFSLGEVQGDTLFVHIEKADRNVDGAYQMQVAQFAQLCAHEGVAFLNREDDSGDPGLRTSKLSYHPVAILEKYTAVVEDF